MSNRMKVFTCTDFRSIYHTDGTTCVCPAFALVTAVDADQARDVLFDKLTAIGMAPTLAEKAGWTMLLRQHTYGPTCLLLSFSVNNWEALMTPTTMHQDDFRMHCDNYAGLCRNCGEITESGCEPDADGILCECCGEHTVVGFEDALIEGLIVLTDEGEPAPAPAPAASRSHPLRPWHDLVDPTDTAVPEPGVHLVHRGNAMTVVHELGPRQPLPSGGFAQTTSRLEGSDTLIADVPDGVIAIDTRAVGLEAAWDYVWQGPYADVRLPRWGSDDNYAPMTGYPRSVGVDLAAAVALRAGIPVGVVWKGALHHPSIGVTTDKPVAWTTSSRPTTHGPAVQAAAAFANRDFEPEFLRALVLAIRNPGTQVDLRVVNAVINITATLMSGKES